MQGQGKGTARAAQASCPPGGGGGSGRPSLFAGLLVSRKEGSEPEAGLTSLRLGGVTTRQQGNREKSWSANASPFGKEGEARVGNRLPSGSGVTVPCQAGARAWSPVPAPPVPPACSESGAARPGRVRRRQSRCSAAPCSRGPRPLCAHSSHSGSSQASLGPKGSFAY